MDRHGGNGGPMPLHRHGGMRRTPPCHVPLQWRAAQPGLDVGSVRFAGAGARVTVQRRAAAHRLPSGDVATGREADAERPRAAVGPRTTCPDEAAFVVNAGMFDGSGPWGWLVLDGAERQRPGIGPLSSAVVVDTSGAVRIVAAPGIAAARASGTAHWAVQSYPTALVNGVRSDSTARGWHRRGSRASRHAACHRDTAGRAHAHRADAVRRARRRLSASFHSDRRCRR